MKKIVITGGLGYIGYELCKVYSGKSRSNNIIVADNRFSASKVKQLKKWGIDYRQCSILDKERIAELVKDADVVIHLAGITDVAYTNTESNPTQDELIRKTGEEGTLNILDSIGSNCKIIFPSTHVVFEGVPTMFDISESFAPWPILAYSESKFQSERDIEELSSNYVILRLGSVYGYSDSDFMRINIMPNLFSKIASQNGTISLYSGGQQYKSLVALKDVVRCIEFMEDSNIKNQTFHLSNENLTVKDVADICKKINPNVNIETTNDEVPNLGYTLSNEKLLSYGFNFIHDIETEIKEMVSVWSDQELHKDLEKIDRGGKGLLDGRGKIVNYELTEPINLVGYIESEKCSIRANHYHPIQEQKCLLIRGAYISVTQDLSKDSIIETKLIQAGDLSIIKPNVAHTMIFLEDSIFLNLVNGEREHENYGVTHTIPYELVDGELADNLIQSYVIACRACQSRDLERVVSLGMMPLANNLISNKNDKFEKYPLEINYCKNCSNCQLSVAVDPKKLFTNYLYTSSTSDKFIKHFEDAAQKHISDLKLDKNSLVVDIGSNDGIGLLPFKRAGIKTLGIEPASNLAAIANDREINTLNCFFDFSVSMLIKHTFGKADLITASNVFAHVNDIVSMFDDMKECLKDNGTIILEVQHLLSTIEDLSFDNIYHEHVNYWSLISLQNFVSRFEMSIYDVELVDTHGGSLRCYISKDHRQISKSVEEIIDKEKNIGMDSPEIYKQFGKELENIRENVRKNIGELKNQYTIIGYGSPAKATTLLNFFGLTEKDFYCVIEDNSLKHNKFIPGTGIPVKHKDILQKFSNENTLIVVLAWNFFDYILEKNKNLLDTGVRFISIRDLFL